MDWVVRPVPCVCLALWLEVFGGGRDTIQAPLGGHLWAEAVPSPFPHSSWTPASFLHKHWPKEN